MRFFVHTTALALCVALIGCVSSRGLHTTGTLTDPRSLKAEQSLADVPLSPTAWPAQDWWIGFGDPQLTDLINEALQNNPSLDEVRPAPDRRRRWPMVPMLPAGRGSI